MSFTTMHSPAWEAATRLMRGDQGVARLGWESGGTNPRIFKLRDQAGPGT